MGNCLGLCELIGSPDRMKGLHRIRTLLPDNQPSTRRSKRQSAQRSGKNDIREVNVLTEATEDLKAHYDLCQELGRGQFGVIRLCKSKQTGEQFACKSIAKSRLCSQKDLDAVRREIQIMKQLQGHPKIVELKAVYEDRTWIHLVMELCEGGELFDKILKQKPHSENDAAEICKSLMEAVQFCQSHGVIHRDLKPENILLVSRTYPSQIKVADFGLAVNIEPGEKISGTAGSAYYIAPEVLKGEYSMEVDVWSSGVVLYILLCGMPPFWDSTEEGIFDAIKYGHLDLCSDPWPSISSAAKDLIRGMLCPDIRKRLTPERVLRHEWIVKHTQTSKTEQSSSLQQDSHISHTSWCFDASPSVSCSVVSEDSSFLSRNCTSLASSFEDSFIQSTYIERQTAATLSQEKCKREDKWLNPPPADEGSLQFETWISFIRFVDQILHELSCECVSKANKDINLIPKTIALLQSKNGLKCTTIEATSSKETVIVDLCKEKFLVVLDRENERIGWKHVEKVDSSISLDSSRSLLWSPCSAAIRIQAQPRLVC
ncbi:hypothetical protein O6H91_11G002900 [Diphasiastrum complanatum]|uniref:Uncharacterized protein n=1 Tax=Diphasiastrum complanatum TaxID=34168 RepID=A0ACC2C5S9_DIPCM|nr:hypothetical protein O6H91_11G002900 [Diphasiastrum complanatum]